MNTCAIKTPPPDPKVTSIRHYSLYFYFLQLYCPNGIFPMGNSGCLPQRKPAVTVALPNLRCMQGPNTDMDYGILNERTNVNASDCTWGCTGTLRESALKVDSRGKIPCCTGESNPCQLCAGPMLYQLGYIPIHCQKKKRCRINFGQCSNIW